VFCRLPESSAQLAFRFSADLAWRRQGPSVQVLEGNLRRVIGSEAPGGQLRGLSRQVLRSYARYWLEVFRLPVIPVDRLLGGMHDTGHLRTAFGYLAAGRGVILALPHMGNYDLAGAWLIAKGAGSVTAVAERLQPESVYDRFVAFREGLGRGHEEGIGPVHLTAQNGDLMPERENLDLPGLVTAPEQDQELEETTEDEVEEGPQHK